MLLQDVKPNAIPHTKIRAGVRNSLFDYREVFRYSELLIGLAVRDIKVRYKQTVLGILWVVLQPLAAALIFSFVFGVVAQMPSHGKPYLLFAFSGLLVWNLFAATLQKSSAVMLANSHMITKVYFPREVLPFSAALSALVDFGVSLIMLLLMMAIFRVPPSPAILLLPVWVGLLQLLALGVGLMGGAIMVRYRDAQHIIPMVLQMAMYVSPVAWPVSAVPAKYRLVYLLNPLSGLLEACRWSMLGEGTFSFPVLAYAATCSVLMFLFGSWVFRRLERGFADVI